MGFRPGVVAVQSGNGTLVWHALNGLLADPLTAEETVLWTIIKDFDEGTVALAALEPETGLEQSRQLIGDDPSTLYQLRAYGRQVLVLGESLWSYSY